MVLTYSLGEERPQKDWILKTEQSLAGDSLSYLDKMERNKEEDTRKERERQVMQEGKALWERKRQEEEELQVRDVEETKEIVKQKIFGRPGHGAPTQDIRKKKFTEHQLDSGMKRSQSMFGLDDSEDSLTVNFPTAKFNDDMELDKRDALFFGRGGNGAPMRTNSGRLRSTVYANPEIRFQADESVQKSISNNIRYAVDKEDKSIYQQELEDQIRQKCQMQEQEKNCDISVAQHLDELEGTQWGKAGPGGAYWRDSAISGQGFFNKMGWNTSADPRRRSFQVKKNETDDMKREMSEIEQRRVMEHREMRSEIGTELAPLMKNAKTGKPRKDQETGYMMDHSLSSTDVTRLAIKGPQPWLQAGNQHQYSDQLSGQISEKQDIGARGRELDEIQQKQHFESWQSFWGKPGCGAPRDTIQKENLMKMLHYPDNSKNAPDNGELSTLERLPTK
eukprot:TRINITY_DN21643_c0_g1_i1.p1 TRINITY_DN21643_c0_g1~~TRINITY_DN21643_c0_g1_i1.p1  ORF type:complete len:462 (-),score=133.65 TRINITY_DN21643_c0_g1_i1:237-1583(-)